MSALGASDSQTKFKASNRFSSCGNSKIYPFWVQIASINLLKKIVCERDVPGFLLNFINEFFLSIILRTLRKLWFSYFLQTKRGSLRLHLSYFFFSAIAAVKSVQIGNLIGAKTLIYWYFGCQHVTVLTFLVFQILS